MTDHSTELDLTMELSDVADAIAAARFGAGDLVVDRKPNGSPVTDADRAIETAVIERLRRSRPGIPIVGEEHGPAYDGQPTYWTIDPIDGTAAFIAGAAEWGFTICLVEDHLPVAGVASSVGLGRRWWASLGHGTFAAELPRGDPQRLSVSTTEQMTSARIALWDGNAATSRRRSRPLDDIEAMLASAVGSITRTGSAALDVAGGELDAAIMWANKDAPWDQATFALLVREAGGTVTDLAGSARLRGGFVAFSNGLLHEPLRALLA